MFFFLTQTPQTYIILATSLFFLAYPGERLMRLCHGSLSTFTQITTHQILVKLAQTDHLIDLQPHCAQGQGRVCCFMGSNL